MKVYITRHGLRPFRITKIEKKEFGTIHKSVSTTQYKGEYKLPKNTKTTQGKKWVSLDHWFNLEDIK